MLDKESAAAGSSWKNCLPIKNNSSIRLERIEIVGLEDVSWVPCINRFFRVSYCFSDENNQRRIKMTRIKEDIVREVMTAVAIDHKTAKNLINTLLSIMKDELASGDSVLVSGFGEFKIRHKRPRTGRNPKTKIEYEISERTVVTFTPSRVFRKEMNRDELKMGY